MLYPIRCGFLKKGILESRLPKQVSSGRRRLRLSECIVPTFELVPTKLALFQMLLGPTRACKGIRGARWPRRTCSCIIGNIEAGVFDRLGDNEI